MGSHAKEDEKMGFENKLKKALDTYSALLVY